MIVYQNKTQEDDIKLFQKHLPQVSLTVFNHFQWSMGRILIEHY